MYFDSDKKSSKNISQTLGNKIVFSLRRPYGVALQIVQMVWCFPQCPFHRMLFAS